MIRDDPPDMRTLSVGLTTLHRPVRHEWHLLMAAATVTLLPTLLISPWRSATFVEGIARPALGGR